MLNWGLYRNLENSTKDFLDEEIFEENVTDYNNVLVPVRIGRKDSNDWSLPCISVYCESETSPARLYVGSNLRDRKFLLIFDIYATDEGERLDISSWLTKKIENGFRYYEYTQTVGDPENPTKTSNGLVNIDTIINNTRVKLGDNVDTIDAHRHRISLNVWIGR